MASADRLRGAGHVRRDGVGVRQPATCRVGERHARGGRHRGRVLVAEGDAVAEARRCSPWSTTSWTRR
ncbi:MAG: hypothetical protein ACLR3C_05670 [Eggerthella lenta]